MSLARFLTSAALALAVAGSALAQQAAPAGSEAPPAKEYNQQILVPGSWFHGVHGLAFIFTGDFDIDRRSKGGAEQHHAYDTARICNLFAASQLDVRFKCPSKLNQFRGGPGVEPSLPGNCHR